MALGSVASAERTDRKKANAVRTAAAGRDPDEVRAYDHLGFGLHVPERECALQNVDAIAVRPLALCGRASAATTITPRTSEAEAPAGPFEPRASRPGSTAPRR